MAGDDMGLDRRRPGSPFGNGTEPVAVVLPWPERARDDSERAALEGLHKLFASSLSQLGREVGAELELTRRPHRRPCWLIGPAPLNPELADLERRPQEDPILEIDRSRRRLISDAPTLTGVYETFSLLFSVRRLADGVWPVRPCDNLDDALDTVMREVATTWPSFVLHAIDWQHVCDRHLPLVRAARDPVPAIQAWLAELRDGHTWLRCRQRRGQLPYGAVVRDDDALLWHVPSHTEGWRAGARAGFRLLGVESRAWFERTAATPHQRPLLAGRGLLEGPIGAEITCVAEGPAGERVHWRERIPEWPWPSAVEHRRLRSGAGYLRINLWLRGHGVDEAIDRAFAELACAPGLIVDLRGNGGGDLNLARSFRDRFLREPGPVGTIQYRDPDGGLTEPEPILAEPAPLERRWAGPVRFLTDPLTYSSSEDALLGLQGLPHVRVVGERSGGGSGRVRRLRLLADWDLTITTCHTFARTGECIEGRGVAVDLPVAIARPSPNDDDLVLAAADVGW